MKEHNHNNRNTYDNPIPKPPDEMFDDFLKNMEERLVTRRFDVNRRRGGNPTDGRRESR